MMRRTMILALAIAGCNGGGESTTAAEPMAETSTGTSEDTVTPPGTTVMPVTDDGLETSESGQSETMPEPTTAEDTTVGEDTIGTTTTGECPEVELVGTWLSEGENVAPLLVDVLNLASVEAIFEEVTYVVNSTDGDGAMYEQTGTWTSELCPGSETKYRIVLEQTAPSALTAEGIYEIDSCMDPALMRYEVIQTMPDMGFAPPTCDDDFGAGAFGADNIQTFVRQ
jgi:hypothetical protein